MANIERRRGFLHSRPAKAIIKSAMAAGLVVGISTDISACSPHTPEYSLSALAQNPGAFEGSDYKIGPIYSGDFRPLRGSVQVGGTIYDYYSVKSDASFVALLNKGDEKVLEKDKKTDQSVAITGSVIVPEGSRYGWSFQVRTIGDA
ncbi:MAG TPA: hypothetical protein VLF93_01910 [Candidatus Saccharimonadales bacterium]|nr:hypothetical protein [Candidatus Saccharimonadales bacterium]